MHVLTQERIELGAGLKDIAVEVVDRAIKAGATSADAIARDGNEFSTLVRLGEVETLKESGARALGLRVFVGKHAAATHTSDFSREGIERLVSSAITLARATSEDPDAGLPDAHSLGSLQQNLDLYYDDVYSLSTADRC